MIYKSIERITPFITENLAFFVSITYVFNIIASILNNMEQDFFLVRKMFKNKDIYHHLINVYNKVDKESNEVFNEKNHVLSNDFDADYDTNSQKVLSKARETEKNIDKSNKKITHFEIEPIILEGTVAESPKDEPPLSPGVTSRKSSRVGWTKNKSELKKIASQKYSTVE